MKPAQVQRVLRRITFLLAAVGGLYIYSRFSLMTLPAEGCSPIERFAPGTSLLLDQRPPQWGVGDAVLFGSGADSISLGEVGELRSDGSAWIVINATNCPGASSAELGWIAEDRLVARVIFAARW